MKIGGLVSSGELYRDKRGRIGGTGKGMIKRIMDIQSWSLHTNLIIIVQQLGYLTTLLGEARVKECDTNPSATAMCSSSNQKNPRSSPQALPCSSPSSLNRHVFSFPPLSVQHPSPAPVMQNSQYCSSCSLLV